MLAIINSHKSIGETYIQYPGEQAPADIWGGTWTAIFDDEGIFFRTPGGTASNFESGIQQAANTAHTHERGTMEITGTFGKQTDYNVGNREVTGAFTYHVTKTSTIGDNFYSGGSVITFTASKSWTGATTSDGVADGRPKNRTIRLWKKTK